MMLFIIHFVLILGILFIEAYGWILLIIAVLCWYLKSKFDPKLHRMKQKWQENKERANYGE